MSTESIRLLGCLYNVEKINFKDYKRQLLIKQLNEVFNTRHIFTGDCSIPMNPMYADQYVNDNSDEIDQIEVILDVSDKDNFVNKFTKINKLTKLNERFVGGLIVVDFVDFDELADDYHLILNFPQYNKTFKVVVNFAPISLRNTQSDEWRNLFYVQSHLDFNQKLQKNIHIALLKSLCAIKTTQKSMCIVNGVVTSKPVDYPLYSLDVNKGFRQEYDMVFNSDYTPYTDCNDVGLYVQTSEKYSFNVMDIYSTLVEREILENPLTGAQRDRVLKSLYHVSGILSIIDSFQPVIVEQIIEEFKHNCAILNINSSSQVKYVTDALERNLK